MNKLTTLLIASAAAISINANADPLMDIIHPESADIFNLERSSEASTPVALYEYESVGPIVWSYEYEEWVNTESGSLQNVSSVLNEIESNPPASGGSSRDTMSYLTETIDEEYQH